MHYESLKKHNNNSETEKARNYSVLGNSGVSVLSKNKVVVNEGNNPYYPHRIRDVNDQSMSTKFTGNRHWNTNPNSETYIPDPRS